MIPDNITKKHVLKAIAEVDRDGVPPRRGSTKYNLKHGKGLYPPKYLISVANRFANGSELPPSDFSGGNEVNNFLARLGFLIQGGTAKARDVEPTRRRVKARRHDGHCSDCKKKFSPALPVRASGSTVSVATVLISSPEDHTVDSPIELMQGVLQHAGMSSDLLLFAAGYFKTKQRPWTQLSKLAARIGALISDTRKKPIVCFGVDGPDSKDQVAAAVNSNGLLGLARKFHPTKEEAGYINAASDPFVEEQGYSRIINVGNKRAFLAVCNDGFGISYRGLDNPGVDFILDLIHGFYPKGEGGSGDVYFAKHGLAGASKQWGCPAFGAAVFFKKRPVPEAWPSGVLWNQGSKSTRCWKYSDNPLQPVVDNLEVSCGKEIAIVRVYHV